MPNYGVEMPNTFILCFEHLYFSRFNENEDFHEKYEQEDQEGGASLPKKLIQGKP